MLDNRNVNQDKIDHNKLDISTSLDLLDLIEGADIVVHLAARGNVIDSILNPIENFNSTIPCSLFLKDIRG